jgi:hypothetical protein
VAKGDKLTVRNLLGEQLFPKVNGLMNAVPMGQGVTVGKITGMLLELDHQEILGMLEDRGALEKKIQEASQVRANFPSATPLAPARLPPPPPLPFHFTNKPQLPPCTLFCVRFWGRLPGASGLRLSTTVFGPFTCLFLSFFSFYKMWVEGW